MKKVIETCYKLRLAVGYLGEKNQHDWWPSAFLAGTGSAFLLPIFPRSANLAAYHGVVEAARLLHDKHIGIGRVFHLFRLPEEMEHELHHGVHRLDLSDWRSDALRSPEAATGELERLASGGLTAPEGPVRVGTRRSLWKNDSIEDVARHYVDAFRRGIRCFPYFTES